MIREKLNDAMKRSMKEKDVVALSTIRLIMAAIKDRDIAVRSEGKTDIISDSDIMRLLQSMIKQRRESVRMYKEGGRDELAAREQEEIRIISEFLPEQMDDAQIRAVGKQAILDTQASGIRDMGKVIGKLKERYAGRMDFAQASHIIKEMLSSAA